MSSVLSVCQKLYQEHMSKTSKKLKIIDAYLVYTYLTAVIQFVYCWLIGTFPFNTLGGFISALGSFILALCLRIQVNPKNKNEFRAMTAERAFAHFIFAHLVLHCSIVNFLG